jgi:hypothetical protein
MIFTAESNSIQKSNPSRIGLIVLAHDAPPYIAAKPVPEILTATFSVHLFSLRDCASVASRFDTAGDFSGFASNPLKEAYSLWVGLWVGNVRKESGVIRCIDK